MTSSSYDWIAYGQGFASGLLAVVSTGYIGYLATKYIQKKKRDVMLVDMHTSNVVLQGASVANNPSNVNVPLMLTVAYEQRGVLREVIQWKLVWVDGKARKILKEEYGDSTTTGTKHTTITGDMRFLGVLGNTFGKQMGAILLEGYYENQKFTTITWPILRGFSPLPILDNQSAYTKFLDIESMSTKYERIMWSGPSFDGA